MRTLIKFKSTLWASICLMKLANLPYGDAGSEILDSTTKGPSTEGKVAWLRNKFDNNILYQKFTKQKQKMASTDRPGQPNRAIVPIKGIRKNENTTVYPRPRTKLTMEPFTQHNDEEKSSVSKDKLNPQTESTFLIHTRTIPEPVDFPFVPDNKYLNSPMYKLFLSYIMKPIIDIANATGFPIFREPEEPRDYHAAFDTLMNSSVNTAPGHMATAIYDDENGHLSLYVGCHSFRLPTRSSMEKLPTAIMKRLTDLDSENPKWKRLGVFQEVTRLHISPSGIEINSESGNWRSADLTVLGDKATPNNVISLVVLIYHRFWADQFRGHFLNCRNDVIREYGGTETAMRREFPKYAAIWSKYSEPMDKRIEEMNEKPKKFAK